MGIAKIRILGIGVLGMVQSGEVDIGCVAKRITAKRFERLAFSAPTWFYRQTYQILKPETRDSNHYLMNVFQPTVWMLILATFASMISLSAIKAFLSQLKTQPKNPFAGRKLKRKDSVKELRKSGSRASWQFVASITAQKSRNTQNNWTLFGAADLIQVLLKEVCFVYSEVLHCKFKIKQKSGILCTF